MRFLAACSWFDLARWTGALSSWKKCPFRWKCLTKTGHRFSSEIYWYFAALKSPSIGVLVSTPFQQMYPHIITLYLAWGVLCRTRSVLHHSFFLQILTLTSCPIIILLSSENMRAFLVFYNPLSFPRHQESRFFRLVSLITSFSLTILLL